MSHRSLPANSLRFREQLINALGDVESFAYIDADCFVGRCPACGGAVGVRFAGLAARATLNCHDNSCSEAEIAEHCGGLVVRP